MGGKNRSIGTTDGLERRNGIMAMLETGRQAEGKTKKAGGTTRMLGGQERVNL